jgi:hypothetical protein
MKGNKMKHTIHTNYGNVTIVNLLPAEQVTNVNSLPDGTLRISAGEQFMLVYYQINLVPIHNRKDTDYYAIFDDFRTKLMETLQNSEVVQKMKKDNNVDNYRVEGYGKMKNIIRNKMNNGYDLGYPSVSQQLITGAGASNSYMYPEIHLKLPRGVSVSFVMPRENPIVDNVAFSGTVHLFNKEYQFYVFTNTYIISETETPVVKYAHFAKRELTRSSGKFDPTKRSHNPVTLNLSDLITTEAMTKSILQIMQLSFPFIIENNLISDFVYADKESVQTVFKSPKVIIDEHSSKVIL